MKKAFLETWRGVAHYCEQQTKWKLAEGSSLTKNEKQNVLDVSGVVFHPKGKSLTKLFVKDEAGGIWSIIIDNFCLDDLKKELQRVGYKI